MSAMEYETENGGRYEEESSYNRTRSASPRAKREDDYRGNRDNDRQASRGPIANLRADNDEPEAANTGTNLFVTGIPPKSTEVDVTIMFSKFGTVKNCAIMKDPHTRESRGFGFVEMTTTEEASAAKDGLSGENIEGRTLSIEMARRARPRTPTPGKYYGPPKQDGHRTGRSNDNGYGGGRRSYDRRDNRGYERRDDRHGDRRGGGDRGYTRRDDRGDDRRGGNDRYGGGDRYGGRDDRRGDDRRDRGGDRGSSRFNDDAGASGGDRR